MKMRLFFSKTMKLVNTGNSYSNASCIANYKGSTTSWLQTLQSNLPWMPFSVYMCKLEPILSLPITITYKLLFDLRESHYEIIWMLSIGKNILTFSTQLFLLFLSKYSKLLWFTLKLNNLYLTLSTQNY